MVPGMGCKDVHILLDLSVLTSRGEIREILTRDFVPPTGPWQFPLTRVSMLKNPNAIPAPDAPDDDDDDDDDDAPGDDDNPDIPRNRSVTKRWVQFYGPAELCDGCLNGTYQHTSTCRERFNRLLNAAEPLPRGDDELTPDTNHEDEAYDMFRLFDTVTPVDVEPVDLLDLDLVPECPQPDGDYTPTSHASFVPPSPARSESSAESGFDETVLGEVVVAAPGGLTLRKGNVLLIEFCCQENSALCKVAKALDVSYLGITKESFNVEDDESFHQLICWVQDEIQQGNRPIHLWGSLPSTVWSPWQHMAIHNHGEEYQKKLLARREKSLKLVERFHELAATVEMSRGGSSSFEWSKDSEGWQEPVVKSCVDSLGMKSVQFDGAFNLEIDGKCPKRQWIVQTTKEKLRKELESKKCSHEKGFHDHLEGSITKKSGFYNMSMAICLVSTLFPGRILEQVPACPVMPFRLDPHRARLQDCHTPDVCVLATIHKLRSRDEMRNDSKAIEAIKEEGRGVRAKDVWLDSNVVEKAERLAQAKREGKRIHLAEVMPIASIKHWESMDRRKYKGRLVFRGTQVTDTWGAAAQFGALYSAPTKIQAIDLAVSYVLLKGNKLTAADHSCFSASYANGGRRDLC